MMPRWRRRILTATAALALGVASPLSVHAQAKIGFVDVPKILEKAPQAELARSRIEKEFAPRDRKLVSLQKELREQEDKLIRDRDVMAAAERQKLERQIRTAKRDLRRSQDEFRDDLNLRRNQELAKLRRKVILTIRAIGKASTYDLIVVDGVLYASNKVDITETVLNRLKTEFNKSKK